MAKLKWWMRAVGAFYLLLTLMNIYGIFLGGGQMLTMNAPFAVDAAGVRLAGDFWLVFVLDLLVIGAFLIWAARRPLKYIALVWVIVWLELIRGIADDLYLIAQGYQAGGYIAFIVIHIVIIGTGILFARETSPQPAA